MLDEFAKTLKIIVKGATQRFTQCTLYAIYAAVMCCMLFFVLIIVDKLKVLIYIFSGGVLFFLFVGLVFQLMLIRNPLFCVDSRAAILNNNLKSR